MNEADDPDDHTIVGLHVLRPKPVQNLVSIGKRLPLRWHDRRKSATGIPGMRLF